MLSPGDRLRDLAAECLVLARAARYETMREELVLIAEKFARLARVQEGKPSRVRL